MLYYLRNEIDGLIGLQYNDEMYYYMKNAQNNITVISKELHYKISGYYSSIPTNIETSGMRVRDYLTGQSFDSQYEFGIKVIELFKDK